MAGGLAVFRLRRSDGRPSTRVSATISKLGTPGLRSMGDMALLEVGRALTSHAQQGDPSSLDEAEEAAAALLEVVQELKRR